VSSPAWRRAARPELPGLAAFLSAREERCAGFAGRLLRGGELRLPAPIRGGVWLAGSPGGGITGALLCHPSGLAFPLLPKQEEADPLLARELARLYAARIWRAASATGLSRDVERLEALAGLPAIVKVGYILMCLPAARMPLCSAGAAPISGPPSDPGGPAFSVRRAGPADLEALLPLQEAYEREEVLTPIHDFNPAACRAALARSLELQLVYLAEDSSGRPLAKAATNARGFRVDQIGGVFTLPERRGRGAARALMAALLAEIGRAGRSASLFVKPGNAPALGLYRGLGFEEIGEYRADYFRA